MSISDTSTDNATIASTEEAADRTTVPTEIPPHGECGEKEYILWDPTTLIIKLSASAEVLTSEHPRGVLVLVPNRDDVRVYETNLEPRRRITISISSGDADASGSDASYDSDERSPDSSVITITGGCELNIELPEDGYVTYSSLRRKLLTEPCTLAFVRTLVFEHPGEQERIYLPQSQLSAYGDEPTTLSEFLDHLRGQMDRMYGDGSDFLATMHVEVVEGALTITNSLFRRRSGWPRGDRCDREY